MQPNVSMITLHDEFTLYGSTERYGPISADSVAGGLGAVLDRAPIIRGETTVIVDGDVADWWDVPDAMPAGVDEITDHEVVTSLRKYGWEGDGLRPWMRLTRGEATVYVCMRQLVDPASCPLLVDSRRETAHNLMTWHAVMGVPWWGTGGMVGSAMLRLPQHHDAPKGRQDGIRWRLQEQRPEWGPSEMPYHPKRWDRGAELTGRFEYRIDARNNYLAGWQSVLLAGPRLEPGPREFNPKLAGMWLVELEPWTVESLPDPVGYGGRDQLRRWVATPTLSLLRELHEEGVHGGFKVLKSQVAEGTQLARKFATVLRDTLYCTGRPEVTDSVKSVYARTVGMMSRPGGRVYRPDWTAAIVSHARSNHFRKMRRGVRDFGLLPVRAKTDEITYVGDEPDMPAALRHLYPEGERLGQWRYKIVERVTA